MKDKFVQIYSNLPLNLRNEIIVFFKDYGPITWNSAYIEIINDTAKGKLILQKLRELNII
jgi:hypothetical protein